MKETAPLRCPVCGDPYSWHYVGSDKGGFSAGKAALGAVAFGPVGLAAGALGKKKSTYYCGKCGFTRQYDPK
jgi:hypothetical protein